MGAAERLRASAAPLGCRPSGAGVQRAQEGAPHPAAVHRPRLVRRLETDERRHSRRCRSGPGASPPSPRPSAPRAAPAAPPTPALAQHQRPAVPLRSRLVCVSPQARAGQAARQPRAGFRLLVHRQGDPAQAQVCAGHHRQGGAGPPRPVARRRGAAGLGRGRRRRRRAGPGRARPGAVHVAGGARLAGPMVQAAGTKVPRHFSAFFSFLSVVAKHLRLQRRAGGGERRRAAGEAGLWRATCHERVWPQVGVVRYNCADSLDRTNVGSFFGAVQVRAPRAGARAALAPLMGATQRTQRRPQKCRPQKCRRAAGGNERVRAAVGLCTLRERGLSPPCRATAFAFASRHTEAELLAAARAHAVLCPRGACLRALLRAHSERSCFGAVAGK